MSYTYYMAQILPYYLTTLLPFSPATCKADSCSMELIDSDIYSRPALPQVKTKKGLWQV